MTLPSGRFCAATEFAAVVASDVFVGSIWAAASAEPSAADLDQSKLQADCVPDNNWQPASSVTVTATYPYSISLFGLVVKSGNLNSCTTNRVE